MRVGTTVGTVLLSGLAIHHHFHGPPFDYAGLAIAAAASWIGVPGPGEPVLIAAGVLAAKHKLDLASVLVVAWGAAMAGGVAGWLIGMKAGRRVLAAPGPLRQMRAKALARGDDVFARFTVVAILLAPSWIAGIHRVKAAVYVPTNAFGAALWAGGIGLGAYFIGPTVIDLVEDLGWITVVALVLLVSAGAAAEWLRRRRRG